MILGVSHLVLSSARPDEEVRTLANYGFELSHSRDDVPNKAAKAPFLFGNMPETTIMRLAKSNRQLPLVEIVRENTGASDDGGFAPGTTGFELDLDHANTASVTIRCKDTEQASELWRCVGANGISDDPNGHTVDFTNNAICAGLKLRYVAEETEITPTFLNHEGLVCVAFLCRDADALRARLNANGYEVGECFDLVPFATRLRLFLMRNRSGEIYEFLSLG